MKKILFLLFVFLTVTRVNAQELNLKPGDEFSIESKQIQKSIINNQEDYTFSFKVVGKTKTEYKLQCTLQKARLDHQNAAIKLNTDTIRETKLNYTGWLMPLMILQKPFVAVVSPHGKLLRLEGYDKLVQNAITNWHLTSYMQRQISGNFKSFPAAIIKGMFFQLPDKTINYGSTWTNDSTKTNYSVTAIRGSLLDIVANNDDKSIKGAYVLNTVNGLLEDASVDSAGKTWQKNHQQQLTYGTYITLPTDTAWINMAVTLSYFSETLKSATGGADSAKVYGYLKAHDPVYANDAYYRSNELGLLQQVKGYNTYIAYDSLLLTTPNRFLAGQTSHLFNKTYSELGVSADSTYAVIQYFYKDKQFTDWLHQAFAQQFLPQDTTVSDQDELKRFEGQGLTEKQAKEIIQRGKNSKVNAYLLLDRMHNDVKNKTMQQDINALYLWVTACKEKDDPELLVKAADRFNKLNDEYMKAGDGGRYGLLLYGILLNANKTKAANAILTKTTADLERYTADTLYADHYAAQNLLVYAYYLKYKTLKTTDTLEAMRYLAKAAQYSPMKNEKAYASFYDRVFLNSQESYRDEYINQLFKSGDSTQALKVFADNLNANYDKLSDMQSIYEAHFKGKSFKDFVGTNIVAGWQKAPDFELMGTDGKKHSLADYKGKWLVADFWGTWCSPCREEMPEVNAYNNEINTGKHKGIVLLGIACSDDATNVKKFMASNNYGIPQVMGDNQVTNNYHIPGFPTKVIITPDGKMALLTFGADWRGIVDRFSALYTVN